MSEFLKNSEFKKQKIKEFLKKIHDGEDVKIIKKEFKDFLSGISPLEIPLLEQELLKEGITAKEIAKMCDIHVELFRDAVSDSVKNLENLPDGHPLKTLILENIEIVKDAELASLISASIKAGNDLKKDLLDKLVQILEDLSSIGKTHYSREEMLIFPYLERRGITAVPTVLWTKHDEIRIQMKLLLYFLKSNNNITDEFLKSVHEKTYKLSSAIIDMVFRENNILYPTINILLNEGEWLAIKEQEHVFGYYKIQPEDQWQTLDKPLQPFEIQGEIDEEQFKKLPDEIKMVLQNAKPRAEQLAIQREGDIKLDIGYLSIEELNTILNNLPFDITFIDKSDRVRFFSSNHRIFPRTPSIIGRFVQHCHPPKSVPIVNKILKAFKNGEKNFAEFWIQMNGRFVYIRYIPVYDSKGDYSGTIELVQDITDIKKLEGEKRLLDWKD